MKEELIKFETAKLANNKGYQETSSYGVGIAYYNITGKLGSTCLYGEHTIKASTQSLLQKWLRETHNIFISIDVNYCYKIYNNDELYEESVDYNNYEQALEKGLQEALKLG